MPKIMRNNIEYAGVANWEGTQAQYDALPVKSPDITYFITDANGNNEQFQPVIYSTNEREIGVWTDGKPLYEKSLSPNVTSSSFTVDISSLSVDTMVSIEGNIPQTSGNIVIIPYFTASGDYALCYYNNNYLKFAYAGVYNTTTWKLTIRYTKTTDAAGSGTWTPQGMPSFHYSTDEQVLGTWVDGSTLYHKTYIYTPHVSGPLDVSSLNIDKIIDMRAISHQTSGVADITVPYGWDGNDRALLYYHPVNKTLNFSFSAANTGEWYIYIQYTKAAS